MSQVDTSGRLSIKKPTSSDFHLVIHRVLSTDSGTYTCSVDAGVYQHVTVLVVRGRLSKMLLFSLCCVLCSRTLEFLIGEHLLSPPKKEVMFLVRSVCLFVCLSVCLSVRRITRKLVNGF